MVTTAAPIMMTARMPSTLLGSQRDGSACRSTRATSKRMPSRVVAGSLEMTVSSPGASVVEIAGSDASDPRLMLNPASQSLRPSGSVWHVATPGRGRLSRFHRMASDQSGQVEPSEKAASRSCVEYVRNAIWVSVLRTPATLFS